jgi:FixJ family two-component response regulator
MKEEIMADGVIISIVDDDESVRRAIKRLLGSFELYAEDFASAEDFLISGRSEDSACLILDVSLPGMSGLELQSSLVASNCRLPIIFISAGGDEPMRARALEAGAIDFLQKPFSEHALFKAINSFLVIDTGGTPDLSD